MADDINTFMSEPNISSLKETLYAQQQLLRKLYNELDAEREASATAADEALSAILRLQGEKAAIKMEAEQYRRFSEDKISQMEDSLAIMQDLIYHKDMQVTALDYQVQAYRCRLLNMGYVDHNSITIGCANRINDSCFRREDGRRDKNKGLKEDGSSWKRELCNKASEFEENSDHFCSEGVVYSYWDKIKELDNRVRGIVGVDYPHSSSSTSASNIQTENVMSNDVAVECSKSVHDVFEVPRDEESRVVISRKSVEEDGKKFDLEKDAYRSGSTYHEENICGIANVSSLQPRSDHINMTSEIERLDESDTDDREEQLILLNEIKEKVSLLHDEVRRWKENKLPIKDEPSLSTLQEAMIHFWL